MLNKFKLIDISMETEVQNQLILALNWPELRKNVFQLLDSPGCLGICIAGNLEGLAMMAQILKDENSLDQLYGLSDLLMEELEKSTIASKYTKFSKLVCEKTSQGNLLKFHHAGQEQNLFIRFLAKFYLSQWHSASNGSSFDLLASDGLTVALLATNGILESDMDLIYMSGKKKDITLLSAMLTKKDWVQRLIVGLVQSDSLVQLDLILPGFQNLFVANFDIQLSDIRDQLSTTDSSRRQTARSKIGECLDLYFCLSCSSDVSLSDDSTAEAPGAAAPSATTSSTTSPFGTVARHSTNPASWQSYNPKKARFEVEEQQQSVQSPMDLSFSAADAAADDKEDEDNESVGIGRQQMRAYQQELASAGIEGINCVIVAPTGSGKTLVSVRIAAARLAKDPDSAKVCFLADRKHLVEQQYAAFKEQLPDKFRHRVSCHTGGEGERAPLKFCLKENSVLIVSTQILLNSLSDKSEDGLNGDVGQISLIVFDECHHCDKDHPSKKIMEHYFLFKESNPGRPLPQIIGLTASPGTGQANRTQEAKQHLLKLCANLDCRRLVTVRRCLESLGDHVTSPSFKLHYTLRKESDVVQECVDQLMDQAEAGLLELYSSKQLSGLPRPPVRSTFLYTNFCGELRAKTFGQAGVSTPAAVEVMAVWKYLHHCNVALLLRTLFRSADALKYLDLNLGDINVLGRAATCSLDAALRKTFEQLLPVMRQFVQGQPSVANRSPSLAALRTILVEQFSRDPDSRVLVFVQQRCFTTAVKDFLEAAPDEVLTRAGARTGIMTGTNASGETGGITQTDQSGILAAFRRGGVKILISTSVTEEGIDVQKCNSVIRFCHVTNEIAMVQSRGRGRAEGSAYHVIVPEELSWLCQKEQVNRARDAMVNEALRQLSDLTAKEFEVQVTAVQNEQRAEAADKRELQARQLVATQGKVYNVLCSSCGDYLTSSEKLRKAQNSHHLALDADLISERLESRRESTRVFADYRVLGLGLVHKQCGQRIGILCMFKEQVYPEINIASVVFQCSSTKVRHGPLKQWKLASKFLAVAEISTEDRRSWARQVDGIPDHLRQPEADNDADEDN